jgi:tetratricopeptide (TPR) repeat protein
LYLASTPPKLEDAHVMLDQVRAAGGEDVDLVVRSARLAVMRKDAKTALSEMARAIQLAESNETVVREYLAILLDLGQYDQLLHETDQRLPQAPKAWWMIHLRAVAMVRQGRKEQGIAEWERAIATVDAEKDDRASLLIMQGIAKELGVAQVLPRVLERGKSDPRWVVFAAQLYQSAGDWHNALAMVEQATGSLSALSEDDQLRTLSVAGGVYLAVKPPMADKAAAAYEQVLKKRPDDLVTLNNLACLYIDDLSPSQPEKALEYSQRAYDNMRKNGQSDPLVLDTHGWVMAQAGHVQEGIVLLQQVLQRQPFVEARYHLGEAYIKGNYVVAAVRQLTEANAMIAVAEKNNATVDDGLKTRIQQALAKASALAKEQGPASGQP